MARAGTLKQKKKVGAGKKLKSKFLESLAKGPADGVETQGGIGKAGV